MHIETARVSFTGDRSSNQDRAAVAIAENMTLLTLADGMGGHLNGAEAAEAAVDNIVQTFRQHNGRINDVGKFLQAAVACAHQAVVALGSGIAVHARPRTTLTVCLIDAGRARWAHVGDSRIYLLREAKAYMRTRDHSTVERLYQEGLIEYGRMATHPWRNYVEECVGGEPGRPNVELSSEVKLNASDIIVLCSDGFWAPLEMNAWPAALGAADNLAFELTKLAEQAVQASRPASDNVTAVAARCCASLTNR